MKNTMYALSLLLFAACGNGEKNQKAEGQKEKILHIKGSESIKPVIEKLLEKFNEKNSGAFIIYDGGGSNYGVTSATNKEAEMVFVSRALTDDERKNLPEGYQVTDYALDGIAVIVNPKNPLKKLKVSTLRALYSGKITNWKEIGGKDIPVVLFSRDVNSGTYTFFKEHVMMEERFSETDVNLLHNGEIIRNVAQTPGAIGYIGHADADTKTEIAALSLASEDNDTLFVPPILSEIKAQTYPLSRKVLYILASNADSSLIRFSQFLKEKEAREIMIDAGVLPAE